MVTLREHDHAMLRILNIKETKAMLGKHTPWNPRN